MNQRLKKTSTSRSKSRRSKGHEISVEHRTSTRHPAEYAYLAQSRPTPESRGPEISTKVRTETSLTAKKPKTSKQSQKPTRQKQAVKRDSHSPFQDPTAAQSTQFRRNSLSAINKTQPTGELTGESIRQLQASIARLSWPNLCDARTIRDYYQQIRNSIDDVPQPLFSLCIYLHEVYSAPIVAVLDAISPYQDLINQKRDLTERIEEQIKENQRLFSLMSPTQAEIFRLQSKIQEQRQLIEDKKKSVLAVAPKSKPQNETVNQLTQQKFINDQPQISHFPNSHMAPDKANQPSLFSKTLTQLNQSNKSNNHSIQRNIQSAQPSNSNQALISKQKTQQNGQQNGSSYGYPMNSNQSNEMADESPNEDQISMDPQNLIQIESEPMSPQGSALASNYQAVYSSNPPMLSSKKPHLSIQLDGDQEEGQQPTERRRNSMNAQGLGQNYSGITSNVKNNSVNSSDASNPVSNPVGNPASNPINPKSFKLDLQNMNRAPLGFHDEFYSMIDEFSESWRNQALRQKRY